LDILSCPCGKKSIEFKNGTLGQISGQTNFRPVLSDSERIITWLCDGCYPKAHELALALHAIVKDKHLHFFNLL
jgi:hypothetical protein